MRQLFTQLSLVLRPGARRGLILATVGSVGVGLLDSLGLILILPLVNLATGSDGSSSALVRAVSGVLGDPSTQDLTLVLAVAVVLLFVLKDLGALWFAWWLAGFVATERVRTSARLLHHMLDAPYSRVSSRSSAEMMRTMDTAVLQVFNATINGLMVTVSSAISVVSVLAALVLLAPLPTVVLVVYFGLASLAFDRIAKPRAIAAGVAANDASVRGFRAAFAALGAIKELSLRGTQQHFVDNYRDAQLQGAHAGRVASFIAILPKYLLEILFIVAVGIVIVLGSRSSSESGGAVGLIALFVAAGFRMLPAITSLLASASNIRVGADAVRLVHAEVVAAGSGTSAPAPASAPDDARVELADRISCEDVTYRYPATDVDVLHGVSLEIPRGTSLALVGGSGAGKTTLVDVVVGLLPPTTGRVLVDGTDTAELGSRWYRAVAYVAQDAFLLEASLAENVAFDQPADQIDRARVVAALDQAQLLDVVAALPEGIDTPVGERGTRLSGGQRQRIGIARALYRRCQVLVLDEATAALDNETEHRVNATIAELHGQVTVVVIAHRLSTVRHTDQVAYLDGGRVAAVGTFDEVRRTSLGFARLVELGSLDAAAPVAEPG